MTKIYFDDSYHVDITASEIDDALKNDTFVVIVGGGHAYYPQSLELNGFVFRSINTLSDPMVVDDNGDISFGNNDD